MGDSDDCETVDRQEVIRIALVEGQLVRDDGRARSRGLHNLSPRRAAIASRAAAQAACLADTAREAALDLLGDTEGAVAIAERRLRSDEAARRLRSDER